MDDIADWILDGAACQVCGVYIDDGEEPGYPRTCFGCQEEPRAWSKAKLVKPFECRGRCGKRFHRELDRDQHERAVHKRMKVRAELEKP